MWGSLVKSKFKILSTPVPFVLWQLGILPTPLHFGPWPWWQSGLPFLRYNLLKIQDQRSRSRVPYSVTSWLISLVFHIGASYWLPSLLFHDNLVSQSLDTILPWKFKVKRQDQSCPSQHSIRLIHFLFVSHQFDQPFLKYGKYNVQLRKNGLKFHAKIP